MIFPKSFIYSACLVFSCAILIKASPLPGPKMEAKSLTNDIEELSGSLRMDSDAIRSDKSTSEIPHREQGPGDGSVASNIRAESKPNQKVQKANTLNKNVDEKKSPDLSNQKNSFTGKIRQKIDELRNTLKSQWPKKNIEEANAVVQPDGKSVVGLKSTRTTSLKNAGPLKIWYFTSKSTLARFFRLVRRYFTLNKKKPETPPEKTAEEAEKAVEVKPPVKAEEVKDVVDPPVTSEKTERLELPEKNPVKSKKKVVPVDGETLRQAIESITPAPARKHEENNVLTTTPPYNLQAVNSR